MDQVEMVFMLANHKHKGEPLCTFVWLFPMEHSYLVLTKYVVFMDLSSWKFCWICKIEKKKTIVINFAIDRCKLGMMDHGLCLNKETNRHCSKQVKLFFTFVYVKFVKIWKSWLNKCRSSILKENKEFKAMFTIFFT